MGYNRDNYKWVGLYGVSMSAKATTKGSTEAMNVAGEALVYAADCIGQIAEHEHMGEHYTWRRAFNAAYDHNVESESSGNTFETADDMYSEVIADVTLKQGFGGPEAAEKIRQRGNNLLRVA